MKQILGFAFTLVFLLAGCSTIKFETRDYPVYVYHQPYDLVYLRAYETLDAAEDWIPNLTDKPKGIIEVKNTKYGNLSDADIQKAHFVITMVSRTETSVSIDPKKSKCQGDSCSKLLDSINETLSQLPLRPAKQQAAGQEAPQTL